MRRQFHPAHAGASSHGIDLAPMLDFVVNLLIFFIITAVFIKESGLTVNRPSGFSSVEDKAANVIEILESGEIVVNGLSVDSRAVRAHVERMSASAPERGVLIVAADGASTGTLVQVVDQVHLGGIHDVTFSTARSE